MPKLNKVEIKRYFLSVFLPICSFTVLPMRNRAQFNKYARLYLCPPYYLVVTVRPGKGREKSIKIKAIKNGQGKLTFTA